MLKLKVLAIQFCLISSPLLYAQIKTIESNSNLEIRVNLLKLETDSKKDKYLMEISLENKREYDIFYPVSKTPNSNYINTSLGFIKVHNANGLIKTNNISGELTRWQTTNNEVLVMLATGKVIKDQFKFSVSTGEEPVLTFSGNATFKKLQDFNLRLNDAMINGTWNSSCLSNPITLSYVDTGKINYLLQSINGRYVKWIKQTENTFLREETTGTTLTYNRSNGQFQYSNSDGVFCAWKKEE
jgi:hypothetical protein